MMLISQVADAIGVPAPTIRSWERRYGFPSPPRTDGSHRRYSREEVGLLRALRDEVAGGRSTRDAVARVKRIVAARSHPAFEDVESFLKSAMELDATALRRMLDRQTRANGFEATVERVAFPAMREIGVRWETGACSVGHEHLATEQVQSWLRRQAARNPSMQSGRVILACGPEDLHRLGLDAFATMLTRRGWDTRLLGALVPPTALVTVANETHADAIVVSSHMRSARRAAIAALREARTNTSAKLFFAGNAFVTATSRRSVPGTYLGEDLSPALGLLEEQLERQPAPV